MERKQDNSSTTDEIIAVGEPSDKDILTEDTPQSTPDETSSSESQSSDISDDLPPSTTEDIMALWQLSIENMLERIGYVNVYSYEKLVSCCVFECLTSEQVYKTVLSRKGNKRHADFEEDPDIDPSKRAKLADYKKWPEEKDEGKYQKGHLAPASNHRYNRNAFYNTFFLSNVVPMCPNVNIAIRGIEATAQELAKRHGKVYTVTGPYFNQRSERECNFVKDDHKVRVPEGIFKVVVHESENKGYDYFVRAYYIENSANSTSKKRIKLEDLNKIIGLNLLGGKSFKEEKDKSKDAWWTIKDILGDGVACRDTNRSGGR